VRNACKQEISEQAEQLDGQGINHGALTVDANEGICAFHLVGCADWDGDLNVWRVVGFGNSRFACSKEMNTIDIIASRKITENIPDSPGKMLFPV